MNVKPEKVHMSFVASHQKIIHSFDVSWECCKT